MKMWRDGKEWEYTGELIYIPDSVMSRRISHGAKLVVGMLGFMRKKCLMATAPTIASRVGLSSRRTSEILSELRSVGLAHAEPGVSSEQAADFLKRKESGFGLAGGGARCSWCRTLTATLHSHHYPVAKRDGGVSVVEICPNCHSEFHFLNGPRWIADVDFGGFYG